MTNKILALKYRPQDFKDLIGQEVMAQTITNAIKIPKTNAIPPKYGMGFLCTLRSLLGLSKTFATKAIFLANGVNKNVKMKELIGMKMYSSILFYTYQITN